MVSQNVCGLSRWACPNWFRRFVVVLTLANTSAGLSAAAQPTVGPLHRPAEWVTHAHDAQHTGVSPLASQRLAKIHWHVPVDLAPPEAEIFVHYGSPLI